MDEEENMHKPVNPLYNEELDNSIKELKLEIYNSAVKPLLTWINKRPYVIVVYGLFALGLLAYEYVKLIMK